ncbi:phosphate signaling complex protein PhoU [Candidatus Methanoperedens nitratireducens]|uniref:Phosphate-specific transport system accessory protein PhoU n=1 Tax=Candidatus Methanoperedens nitratireducens TaxID=1392998 RepID=A0A284VJI7_9EURY|nr:phosphate signaling complex protein PhoU [Candidatus Methanoperedens nitroreducens]SNQ59339.1 Phosphate-specific transport system accessory protein PhoU homolog [Candidatus Methanoperedens nitroreducens]
MVREAYHKDLHKLREEILNMGSLAGKAIGDSVLSLKNRDVEMAQKVIDMDNEIDALDHSIEENCMRLLALQQPMARDLRLIISVLKMSIDLERMGDLALEIAVITKITATVPPVKPLIDIPRMSEICQDMLTDTMKALENKDVELAKQVAKRDDEVDALFDQIRRELITIMIEDPKKITGAQHLTFVARYLERIGDHITNLCENVVFMVTGERVELN